jgi:5-methylcytosine-specific restriction endonuclease McrA
MECGHIIAHALGGNALLDNLMPVCKSCNRDMGTMNLEEYKCIVQKNI